MALAIIADFDNFVFEAISHEPLKKLLGEETAQKLARIQHTTSRACKETELSLVKGENDSIRPLRVTWKSRGCCNKSLFVVYRAFRCYYVSYYFYFQPFAVIISSIVLPLLFAKNDA